METWEWILLLIVGLVIMIVLIGMATNYFRVDKPPEKITGDKYLAIDDILDLVYKCYSNNEGKKESIVCYTVKIEIDDYIFSSDMLEKVNGEKIDKSLVKSDDLGSSGEIVILYQDQSIYIKKVENERIST
jgi:hypothetical protein